MLKLKQVNKLSYVIGIILLVVIISTFINVYSNVVEKYKTREYISTSIETLINKNKETYSEKDLKENMFKFYLDYKGKYVKWTIKANKIEYFFDTIKYYLKDSIKFRNVNELNIKCKFRDDLPKLKKDQEIVVSGQIEDYSEFSKALVLGHCRVEKVVTSRENKK